MNLLLPHRFKRIGLLIAPIGFLLWYAMQRHFISKLIVAIASDSLTRLSLQQINTCVAVISFFAFLTGICFISFSKEKVEDEMVQRVRLGSFQFAAIVQLLFIVIGFVIMLLSGEPGEGGLMLFFIISVSLFWFSFISRFNYILHIKLKP